ncbi:DUF1828 domain-containing protein [Lactococcus lactis subsp. lactis]|nr:hypothetical protein CV702_09530 [Lactococcus lactis subsp. lactis]ATZ01957.1 hypothetical protein CV098_09255 [Lactococcus lactis subsp. lactis]MCT0449950.1 DUF1828 domain-containing protein [Lactococcus lactis subsp. lactis]
MVLILCKDWRFKMDGLKLIEDYVSWYKSNSFVSDHESYTMITTPFVNHINDRIRLYVEKVDDEILITDDGETINELEMMDLDLSNPTRRAIIDNILINFGVKLEDEILTTRVEKKDFARGKHRMLEAIIRLYDLSFTKRRNVISIFSEEVQNYLFDNEMGGIPNSKIAGISGIDYSVDYSIGATKSRPEVLMQFANNFTFDRITTYGFIFDDISALRGTKHNVKSVIIANDERQLAEKALLAAKSKEILVIPWSQKEEILKLKVT